MRQVKTRIFSGAVCEQLVYRISDRARNIKQATPKLRFRTDEERAQHRMGISRRRHARLVNTNFASDSMYSTLTLDNEHEVHTFPDLNRIRALYVRRLKYAYPDAVIFTYMGRGKSTRRMHLHMLSKGVPEEVIRKQWIYGSVVDCDPLREHNYYNGVDHGRDYTGLANYLFEHWTPEQGGHHWHQTQNARQMDREDAQVTVTEYSPRRPPRPPKGYIWVETKATTYGYMYFKYVRKPGRPSRRKRDKSGTDSG